jgi:serine/threonine-protein kinase
LSVTADPRIGSEFQGYRIEALIGRGGMSVVYRAHHAALDRKVALKLLAPELAGDERFRERFFTESRLAASLDHPSIVPIHDAGEVDGQLFIAMRYVEGSDLKRLLRTEGALEPGRALTLVGQLADALDFAHARGLVHRDVKPSNALLDGHEHLYLTDFGLAKSASDRSARTVTGRMLGTVDYAAPEQIEGKPVSAGADVYSLGCLLYECLTGEVPFPRESELAVLWAHVHEPPPRVEAYPELQPVVGRALAKDPQKRFRTCTELVEAASAAHASANVLARRTRRGALLVGAGILLGLGALAAMLLVVSGTGGGGRPARDLGVRGNMLVRIDPGSNKVVGVTRVGDGPESVAAAGNTVWTYNWNDGTVTRVDARTGAVQATIGVPGSTPPQPAQTIAADQSGAWVLSSSAGGGLLSHLRPGLLTQTTQLPGDPLTLALGHHTVWVALRTLHGSSLAAIDPDTNTTTATIPLGVSSIQSLATSPDAVWAITQDGALYRIDPAHDRITNHHTLPTKGLTVDAVATGSGAVWALFGAPSQLLLRVNPNTLQLEKTLTAPATTSGGAIGGGITTLALSNGSLWWNGTDTGSLWRLDPHTNRLLTTIHLAQPIAQQPAFPPYEPLGIATGAGSIWITTSIGF